MAIAARYLAGTAHPSLCRARASDHSPGGSSHSPSHRQVAGRRQLAVGPASSLLAPRAPAGFFEKGALLLVAITRETFLGRPPDRVVIQRQAAARPVGRRSQRLRMAVVGKIGRRENHQTTETWQNSLFTRRKISRPEFEVAPIRLGPVVVEEDEDVDPSLQRARRRAAVPARSRPRSPKRNQTCAAARCSYRASPRGRPTCRQGPRVQA